MKTETAEDTKKVGFRGIHGKAWYSLRKTQWDQIDWNLNDAALGRLNGCSREAVRQQRAKRGIPRSPHWHAVNMKVPAISATA